MALSLVGVVISANVWSGCTVTKSNYKTLSALFDGVPDPDAVGVVTNPTTGEKTGVVSMSIHPPYASENCDECHQTRIRMSKSDSSICAKCHSGKEREHERMHGPVAAQACLWCHNPHESVQNHLLRDKDRALCGQCHSSTLLSSAKVPEHADDARGCLECHMGHGGSKQFMLREVPVKSVPKSESIPASKGPVSTTSETPIAPTTSGKESK